MDINKKVPRRVVILALVYVMVIALYPTHTGEDIILPEPVIIEKLEPIPEVTLKVKPAKPLAVVPVTEDILKKIAWCESKNRQFNPDGSVHRGEINPQDTGKYQINEHYHLADSKKLGMDIYTLAGNTAYANYLLKTQGTTPWNWSKHCWGDVDRVWSEKAGEYWSK